MFAGFSPGRILRRRRMLEILEFIFSSFWVFCGTVILIYVTGMSAAMIVAAASGKETNNTLINIGNGQGKKENKEDKGSAT